MNSFSEINGTKNRKRGRISAYLFFFFLCGSIAFAQTYKIVHTGVTTFYSNTGIISSPASGSAFYGQDANYQYNKPSYTDNHDGTITDNVTGLMWQKDMGVKITYKQAFSKADTMRLGGYSDWRVPSIKELYSLILFTGQSGGTVSVKKYIDTLYFNQPLGNAALGEREIDAQTWSATQYTGLTMNADSTVFGVNFIDGRIKGYPKYQPGSGNRTANSMYFRMVRGNTNYGINNFIDNHDGTISDYATGLMWQQADDGTARDWEHALSYAGNLTLANHSDWRLPSAKELQSIVDYSKSPSATNSAAINSLFSTTMINYPDGTQGQYPYFWTGTTHLDGANPYTPAVYVAFGKALGKMNGVVMDVHGAGAQRSDPKTGNPSDYPQYIGPQGDERIVFNFVRCVRSINSTSAVSTNKALPEGFVLNQNYPNPFNPSTVINYTLPVETGHDQSLQHVSLKVYNALGMRIATLVDENQNPGSYKITFSSDKYSLSSGIYFYSLTAGSYSKCMKMICLK